MQKLAAKFIVLFLSSFLCFLLQYQFKLSPVISATSIGLIGTFVPNNFLKLGQHQEILILAGSFIGMATFFDHWSFMFLILASAMASMTYALLENKFHGLGGKIGFIAFISSSISFFISVLLRLKIP